MRIFAWFDLMNNYQFVHFHSFSKWFLANLSEDGLILCMSTCVSINRSCSCLQFIDAMHSDIPSLISLPYSSMGLIVVVSKHKVSKTRLGLVKFFCILIIIFNLFEALSTMCVICSFHVRLYVMGRSRMQSDVIPNILVLF